MARCPTQIHSFLSETPLSSKSKTGISLHSHTMHSKEYLGRLPTYIAKFPIGSYILEREIGRLHLYEGRIFDFNKFYWTPPLSPREAFALESNQIEKLGLAPLVSLLDHDNIEAGLHLRVLAGAARAPISVGWTVPYEETEFHIGVHNLPASRANRWMRELAEYTAKPNLHRLQELLAGLNDERNLLIVLNHPYWDAKSIGPQEHRHLLLSFLRQSLPLLRN